mmetsp:Transcript_21650/g.49305  ORF Transcript_21650/g.49305 Transcript_21650/m.49305 type:complete len:89 (-) Transcript_21650:1378-1644(-)
MRHQLKLNIHNCSHNRPTPQPDYSGGPDHSGGNRSAALKLPPRAGLYALLGLPKPWNSKPISSIAGPSSKFLPSKTKAGFFILLYIFV